MKAYLTHGSQIQWFQYGDKFGSIHWQAAAGANHLEDAKKMLRGLIGEYVHIEVVDKLPRISAGTSQGG